MISFPVRSHFLLYILRSFRKESLLFCRSSGESVGVGMLYFVPPKIGDTLSKSSMSLSVTWNSFPERRHFFVSIIFSPGGIKVIEELMNYFSITSFAEDFLRTIFRVGTHYFCTTFCTCSFMQFVRISVAHTLFVPLVWMSRWDREVILDIKDEFLFDNLKRSLGYLTFDNTSE